MFPIELGQEYERDIFYSVKFFLNPAVSETIKRNQLHFEIEQNT